jgi:hypothetical protein
MFLLGIALKKTGAKLTDRFEGDAIKKPTTNQRLHCRSLWQGSINFDEPFNMFQARGGWADFPNDGFLLFEGVNGFLLWTLRINGWKWTVFCLSLFAFAFLGKFDQEVDVWRIQVIIIFLGNLLQKLFEF